MAPEEKAERRSLADIIVRAGAVAAAIGSIVGVVTLVWPDSPRRQAAKLSNVSVERNVSLADFSARQQISALEPGRPPVRAAEGLRRTGQPALAAVLLAGPQPGLEGAAPATPEEQGPATPEQKGPAQAPGDTGPPKESPDSTPGSSEAPEQREEAPKATLERALERTIPPSYDLNPSCDESEPSCSTPRRALALVLGEEAPVAGTEATESANNLLRALQETRVRTSPSASGSGSQEVLGVTVSFDLQLEGFAGRRSDVRWSLYDARGKRRVPRDWLVNRRALTLRGRVDEERASSEFWAPLPRRRGPFFVRVGAYDDQGARLTYTDTKPFP